MAKDSEMGLVIYKKWDNDKRETLLPERRTKDAILGDVMVQQR